MTDTTRLLDRTTRLSELVGRLSLEEKVHLLTGETAFTLPGNDRVGLAPLAFSDGPTGVRGLKFIGGDAVALFPNATLIAGAWDDEIAEEVGRMLAEEAQRQQIHVVLGPTINLHRSPLGGRLFEAYSEDPYLTGRTAAAYVAGMQGRGTAACLKHLVANESETLRNFMDSRVSETALRELYLLPFEMAAQDAGAWSMMAAYNDVNGVPATEQDHVQNGIVKGEWDWDGLIMSDWFATKRTAAAANGGLDLVMPGPGGPWGDRLVAAVRAGEVAEETVDEHVVRLLRLAERVGGLTPEGQQPRPWAQDLPAVDSPVRKEQLRRIAARGMTVVANNGVLPLAADGEADDAVALIGRHALETVDMGGGSAVVNPPYQSTVAEGLTALLGGRVRVIDGPAVRARPVAAAPAFLTDPATGAPGMQVVLLAADGTELDRRHEDSAEFSIGWDDDLAQAPATAVLTTTLANDAGPVLLGAVGAGTWTVTSGDREVTAELRFAGKDPGETMLRPPAFAETVELPAGATVTATVALDPVDWREVLLADTSLGLAEESHLLDMSALGRTALAAAPAPRPDEDLIADAERAARAAGTAVVVVGVTEEQETEAADKTTLALPGRQDELVHRVAAAARRTVVVVNAATPVLMPWLEQVDAVLVAGLPGQEGGHAVAAALTGALEPTGRLVTSYPAADGAAPAWDVVPDESLALHYDDGTFVGHRGFHAGHAPAPLFWFGHGLGYGTWAYGAVRAHEGEAGLVVDVEVTNTSAQASRETVQVYLDPAEDDQPIRLAGYCGVEVPAGATAVVTVTCDERLRRRWDEATGTWAPLAAGADLVVARGLGDVRARVSLG
ncbi:glycoside hydrolase family 3 C-terminal domain-containing protein [uncultured Kocuria sp.]|uniref:glycoside hydrolase family 3 protein n=1 Tax=uncultured Kocuria sp. TaxID=259305 RepID=UPI002636893F|nr:glycoside hydrolase family 3 C-terminal domain-containing protein [uncultured Kocuria sp.]